MGSNYCFERGHWPKWPGRGKLELILAPQSPTMAPMKAMKAGAKAMSQGALAQALSESLGLKKAVCAKAVKSLAEIGTQQVKSAGKFVLPGLCMIKTRLKPATKAGKREVFGKVVMVKAKPARTVV